MATLGISTNTRLVGIAIIKQDRLVDYSIHLHKSSWSPSKAKMIVASLEPCVSQYCISRVVLSIPYAHYQTKGFKSLCSRIKAFFESKNIPIYTKPAQALYSFCQEGQKKTKKAMMATLTELFPELRYCYSREVRNKKIYYMKLFEAAAVATLHEQMK